MVSPSAPPVPEPLDNLPVGIEKCKLAANSSSSPKSAGILCGNVEVRGQLVGAHSFFPPRGTQASISGPWTWEQVPLLSASSHWPHASNRPSFAITYVDSAIKSQGCVCSPGFVKVLQKEGLGAGTEQG